MRTLRRNKRPIYLCKSYIEDGITKYEEPVIKLINYEPVNSSVQVFNFGEHYSQNLQAIVNVEVGKEFKEGDKCYINIKPPKEHDVLCEKADYIVNVMPQITLNSVKLVFVKLSETEWKNEQSY